jgi:hypothetical protein
MVYNHNKTGVVVLTRSRLVLVLFYFSQGDIKTATPPIEACVAMFLDRGSTPLATIMRTRSVSGFFLLGN